ncbi:PREDICTED: PHD finger protein 14-like [Branchiostoma belcheri]|uniref:PHD finger protein 14-like n=1 Tax=Branchiostoma belcheri TaxID=7741 RepID=A0A6P4XUU4_BRABE|nr:PREDICTED: PHD finger protein 14-like [Branchiostoma belcheri]
MAKMVEAVRLRQAQSSEVQLSGSLKVLICSICLGSVSEEDDEIVECDNCGNAVHEGCYGEHVSDSASTSSSQSSSSTEPWFCDACRAGVKPSCELCPNMEGIYKQTDAGRWVHVVCALYIPGVAFGDVEKLSPVTLAEMPYSKWGSRDCCLCEDERFSRTGVCIGCDAGMCRNYFHVTCAQRMGLLSEASPDEDIADPFFAHCKLHVDRDTMKQKRQHWMAMQSSIRQAQLRIQAAWESNKERFGRKLQHSQQRYQRAMRNLFNPWSSSEKLPRLLTTSPSAYRRLLRKADLMGLASQGAEHTTSYTTVDVRRRWHIQPAISPEFALYYLDRNNRVESLKLKLAGLLSEHDKLREEETSLRDKYDKLSGEVESLQSSTGQLQTQGVSLWTCLGEITGKKLALPNVLKPPKSPRREPRRDSLKSQPVIHQCGICKQTSDQHLLAKCDTCRLFYHLGCLDPPLSRMPKKTATIGWQCSECASSSESDASSAATPETGNDGTRRTRRQIKEPIKFTPQPIKKGLKMKGHRTRPSKKAKLKTSEVREKEGETKEPEKRRERRVRDTDVRTECCVCWQTGDNACLEPEKRRERRVRDTDVRTECCVCWQTGDNACLVRCDDCQLCFHFACLDPPLTRSPKCFGYGWVCQNCDISEDEDPIPTPPKKAKLHLTEKTEDKEDEKMS